MAELFNVSSDVEILAAMINDKQNVYQDTDLIEYNPKYEATLRKTFVLPLTANEFNFDDPEELSWVNPHDYKHRVETVNEHFGEVLLSNDLVREKFLNVTKNDLRMGSEVLIFNFSRAPVSITDSTGQYKVYSPLKCEKLSGFYGKVCIYVIDSLNLPDMVRAATGADDYLDQVYMNLKDKYQNNSEIVNRTMDVYGHAAEFYKNKLSRAKEIKSNSIKVISVCIVGGNDIDAVLSGEDCFIPSMGYILSSNQISKIAENPALARKQHDYKALEQSLDNGVMSIYINDPKDEISDRYISIAGKAQRINKIRLKNLPSGLFYHYKSDVSTAPDYYTMEELKKSEHIYDSIEKAITGADVVTQYREKNERYLEENKLLKGRLERSAMEFKHEAAIEMEELKAGLERDRREYEREKNAWEASKSREEHEFKKEIELLRKESESSKQLYESRLNEIKIEHEKRKAKDEETIMMFKIGVGVLGLISVGLAIYNKK